MSWCHNSYYKQTDIQENPNFNNKLKSKQMTTKINTLAALNATVFYKQTSSTCICSPISSTQFCHFQRLIKKKYCYPQYDGQKETFFR